MPAKPSSPSGGVRRGKRDKDRYGGLSFPGSKTLGRFFKGAEDIATGLPTGLYQTGIALNKAKEGDVGPAREIGESMLRTTYRDVRHPTENPASTVLTALGLASLGYGTAARAANAARVARQTGSVAKGARAATRQPRPTRTFTGSIKKPGQIPKSYTVPASRNPVARGVRKALLDPAYNISKRRGEKAAAKFEPKLKLSAQQEAVAIKALKDERGKYASEKSKAKRAALKPRTGTRKVPMSVKSAEARIDELEKYVQSRVDVVAKALYSNPATRKGGSGGADKMPRRVQDPSKPKWQQQVGGGNPIDDPMKIKPSSGIRRTAWENTRAEAEKQLYEKGRKQGANPFLKEIADKMDELDELNKAVLQKKTPAIMRDPNEPELPLPKTTQKYRMKPAPYKAPSTAGVDAAADAAKLARAEHTALRQKGQNLGPGSYARTIQQKEEFHRKRFKGQSEAKEARITPTDPGIAREIWQAPTNVMRMGMVTRPRYYVQNIGGTAGMLLAQQPGGIGRSIVRAAKLRKNDPDTYRWAQNTMGESGAGSIAMGMPKTGALSRPTNILMQGANIPESNMRVLALEFEARNAGLTLKQLRGMNPNSSKWQNIVKNANEAVADYSRLGGPTKTGRAEESFVRSGIPIFYPMTKAFTRALGRYPLEHSAQAAAFGHLGQKGKEEQLEGLGGQPVPWFPYLIPAGKDKTLNPQNILPWSPGTDVARQLAQIGTKGVDNPTLSLATNISPAVETAYGAVTGRSFSAGFPLRSVEEEPKGIAALREQWPTVPGYDIAAMLGLVNPRDTEAYGQPPPEDLFNLWARGPAFTKRKTNLSKVVEKKRKKKGRKKSGF